VKPVPLDVGAINAERFWAKVSVGDHGDCWEWKANKTNGGYGLFSVKRILKPAHRIAFALTYGRDPGQKYILHDCDNPGCCNPAHLYEGTQADNMRDMVARGRENPSRRGITHCFHGHIFSLENTWIDKRGRRHCRTCNRERQRARKARIRRGDYGERFANTSQEERDQMVANIERWADKRGV
jgi:hypothetical protein